MLSSCIDVFDYFARTLVPPTLSKLQNSPDISHEEFKVRGKTRSLLSLLFVVYCIEYLRAKLIVSHFDRQLKRKCPSTRTLQVGIHHGKLVRREAGAKLPQFLMSPRVHCSCKLCPLQYEKEPVSASCTSVLSLQFVPFTYTQRGLSLLHVPSPNISPRVCRPVG